MPPHNWRTFRGSRGRYFGDVTVERKCLCHGNLCHSANFADEQNVDDLVNAFVSVAVWIVFGKILDQRPMVEPICSDQRLNVPASLP